MKALSIKQSWVHAILREGKFIENRRWQTKHRGWIALHASINPQYGDVYPRGMKTPDFDKLHHGAICGVARIVGMLTKSRSKWFDQPSRGYVNYGWVLADVKRLRKPIKCKGALQLWNVPQMYFDRSSVSYRSGWQPRLIATPPIARNASKLYRQHDAIPCACSTIYISAERLSPTTPRPAWISSITRWEPI